MRSRRQAFGQHFLHHRPTIERILSSVQESLTAAKAIVEVGPGDLALTKDLALMAQNQQIPLFLIERDYRLASVIESGLEQQTLQNKPELHFMDAASEKFLEFFDKLKQENKGPILFVSNLPYSASSQILANLTKVSDQLVGAIVMVQKELADRMVAPVATKDRGSFSILMQSYFEQTINFEVGPGAFRPPPKVMSTVLKLKPLKPSLVHHLQNPLEFENYCKKLFSQRRKMIRKLVAPSAVPYFANLGISGTERPETLSIEVLLELYRLSTGDVGDDKWGKGIIKP